MTGHIITLDYCFTSLANRTERHFSPYRPPSAFFEGRGRTYPPPAVASAMGRARRGVDKSSFNFLFL